MGAGVALLGAPHCAGPHTCGTLPFSHSVYSAHMPSLPHSRLGLGNTKTTQTWGGLEGGSCPREAASVVFTHLRGGGGHMRLTATQLKSSSKG